MSLIKQQTYSGLLWSAIERFSVQGIQFILSFVIARQLLPSDYGLIAMLAIFMALAQIFVDSGFSNALIQKQNRNQTDYSTVFYFNVGIGILMYILLLLIAPYIATFYQQPLLKAIIKWLGFNLIINSLSSVHRTILTIELDFKRQAFISLVAVLISGLTAVYMALHGYGVWTLVVQTLMMNGINTLLLWITTPWYPVRIFSRNSFKDLFSFGSKILLGGVLHTIYVNLYSLVIGKVFPVRELGLYNRASSLSQFPSTNITGILVRVSYPVFCRLQNDNDLLTEKFYLFIRLVSFIVFPLMIGLAVLSEPLVKLLLTEKWLGAVPYIQILCFAYMWDPIMRMSWDLLNVKHRSDYSLKSEVIKKVIAIAILFISIPLGIKMMCLGLVVYAFFDLFIILQYTKKILPQVTIKNHLKNLFPLFIQTVLMGLAVYLFIQLFSNIWIQLLGGMAIGILLYFLLSIYFSKNEFLYIIQQIKLK